MQQNLKHYGLAMVHSIMGKHIMSYRKLMQDLATLEVWMKAFSKDFGGMCQGNNKMGTKGTAMQFLSWTQRTYQTYQKISPPPTQR
jgi:hypothetical protein